MYKNLVLILFCAVILTGCSNTSFISENKIKEELGLKNLPEQENFPEADAITLWETHDVKTDINTNLDFETTETVHIVKKLFKNIDKNDVVSIYLNSGDIIAGLKARVLQPDGSEIVLGKDDFYTSTGVGGNEELYSDSKMIRFAFPSLKKNSIIEYTYSITKDQAFLKDKWSIQDFSPKLINKYRMVVPIAIVTPKVQGGWGWDWRYSFFNCDRIEPVSYKGTNGTIAFEWVLKDIPGFEEEPGMPAPLNYLEYVKFAPHTFGNWNDVSNWYYKKQFEPVISISSAIKEKAGELTKNCSSELQKIDSVYKFVQKMRYISINIDNSGYIPHSPESILEHGYGDCKDKSLLLLCLLRSLGIKTEPVLVKTNDYGFLNPSFPCWSFNHMIVRVTLSSGAKYWLDGTSEFSVLGDLPAMDEGTNALVLHEDGTSSIEKIPESSAADNTESYSINLDLLNKKDGVFNISIKYTGELNSEHRYFFKDNTNEEIVKHCKSLVANDFLNAEFSNCKVTYIDGINASTILSFDVNVHNLIQQQQDISLLNYNPFSIISNLKWLVKDKRQYPLYFSYPSKIIKDIKIKMPDDKFTLKSLPKNEDISSSVLSYKKNYHNRDKGEISVSEELTIGSKYVNPVSYSLIKKNWETIKNKSNEKLILMSN